MRADRLLSMLMLLQSRGRLTAPELAEELEVSVRTIYRDIDALCTAGVPVYAERGPSGGCVLMEGYRTSLTGLTSNEVKALFMLSVPESLDKLGVSSELRTALHKFAAALPETQRRDEEIIHQRIYLDWQAQPREEKPMPYLQTIHRAVQDDKKLLITYTEIIGGTVMEKLERLVEPYGLVAKGGEWHLVCSIGGYMHVFNVSSIEQAKISSERFTRRGNFNLASYWKKWCAIQEQNKTYYPVKVRISPELLSLIQLYFNESVRDAVKNAGLPDVKEWVTATLPFYSFFDARKNILSVGNAVEVLEPEPLRLSVIDFASQITELYRREKA